MYSTAALDLPALASAQGTVHLPGSKSISNRVLLLAALSTGRTVVHDLLDSDDTRVMLDALHALGCTLEKTGDTLAITGLGGRAANSPVALFLGNAGTAMRPLTAALALLGGDFTLSGVARMHERPIGDLVDALRQLGCAVTYTGNDGYPPLHIGQPHLKLDAPIQVRGDVSSQFLTALLMALPLVATKDIVIEVVGELISKPYIEITLNLLARFGIAVRRDGWQKFTIPAGCSYQSPGDIYVEADASSASYFIALGAIAAPEGSSIRIEGLGKNSIQGDIRFIEAAALMGAQIDSGPNHLNIARGVWPLKAIDLDCNHIPDAAMTLAVMALYANGTTTLRNIASWRVKETDRIAAMACELRKLGATVVEGVDYIQVTPPAKPSADRPPLGARAPTGGSAVREATSVGAISPWKSASIHTYDDHRVAMCFSLAAFNPAQATVRIEDPKCVAKTFPDYFETLFGVAKPHRVPVICIDGPSASGKGTLASQIAQHLGYHYLDSGALYRLTALAAQRAGVAWDDEVGLAHIAAHLPIIFEGDNVLLNEDDVSEAIRSETIGLGASQVSVYPALRAALTQLQLNFAKLPGLVADGRDMGTVIFPNAALKIFLTASAAKRAERRYKQLISKGISAKLEDLCDALVARDARDSGRSTAPLQAAQDAVQLDNSDMSIEQSVDTVLSMWRAVLKV
jgi:3-phosphoshikimate 1-carboxyvinyltransferase